MKTERVIQLLKSRLFKFKLDLDNEIVATIIDSACVKMKYGEGKRNLYAILLLMIVTEDSSYIDALELLFSLK